MSRKINFDEVVSEAAEIVQPEPKLSRFARAKETLRGRPTGYTEVPTDNKQEADLGVAQDPQQNVAVFSVGAAASRLGIPKYMEVPLELIDDNPYNARHIYQPEKVAELANSMAADGQLIPGLAAKRGERFILIAAHYRKKAAKQAGLPTLKLMVYSDVSDQDLYLLSYKENAEHNAQTPLDNAFAWRRVLDQGVYESEVELAEAIGMSKANVNKTLSVMKLDQVVLDIVTQNPDLYGLSVLYELHLLQQAGGSIVAADMASRVAEQGIGRKEIAMARERVEATGTPSGRRRRNETSRLYRLQNGQIRDWDSGRVVIDLVIENEEEKRAIMEEFQRRFKGKEDSQA